MAKSQNQKLKLIYLARLMQEKTDDEHGLSMSEIISELSLCGVKAERKSIYDDFEALRSIGVDMKRIRLETGRSIIWRAGSLNFRN